MIGRASTAPGARLDEPAEGSIDTGVTRTAAVFPELPLDGPVVSGEDDDEQHDERSSGDCGGWERLHAAIISLPGRRCLERLVMKS